MSTNTHAVTGAFGYTGRFIANMLLADGYRVIALTNSVARRNPFENRISAIPFNFGSPPLLTESLRGVSVLYNTYWVRFNHREFTFADAIKNTLVLFDAAKAAGVERIVHISITNPDRQSPLEYFRGKAQVEEALMNCGVSYAILRPAVFFGAEDILINNIAWALRKLPVVGVFGDGSYRLQPIHVQDMADLAVAQGRSRDQVVVDAIGPETFTFLELVEVVRDAIGVRRPIVHVSPGLGYSIVRLLGSLVGDVILTRDEIHGLMSGLLCTDSPGVGKIRLTDWLTRNRDTVGRRYASELRRRQNRVDSYDGSVG